MTCSSYIIIDVQKIQCVCSEKLLVRVKGSVANIYSNVIITHDAVCSDHTQLLLDHLILYQQYSLLLVDLTGIIPIP